ncbi:polysaccharide deacetylase family protein [Falsiroseomonas sp. E2-1-a20]|uniref:polysaccharide deacetylase family protein n=1 Tax=Falsiroseomonas sp. E2-1-a20 TaxID=3239300 RepID=UPI003F36C854
MPDLTLTFDNGPEPAVTPEVLDILAVRGLLATFFVIGSKAATPQGQALMRRAWRDGHWIGNHSWSHSTPFGQVEEPGIVTAEIERTQAAIGELAHPLRLFRPFGGGGHLDRRLLNAEAVRLLRDGGYSCVTWNAVPRDFADPEGWCDTALDQIGRQDWTLMVLHDLPNGAVAHLPRFLDEAASRGFRFRQEIPQDCMPIRIGVAGDLSGLVTPDATAAG